MRPPFRYVKCISYKFCCYCVTLRAANAESHRYLSCRHAELDLVSRCLPRQGEIPNQVWNDFICAVIPYAQSIVIPNLFRDLVVH